MVKANISPSELVVFDLIIVFLVDNCFVQVLALSGLDSSSLRIGQVSGSSSNGAWPITDWVPIIVKSSIRLGCLPDMNKVGPFVFDK